MPDGRSNPLIGWRLTELEKDVEGVRKDVECVRDEIAENRRDSERSLATAFRRIDSITLKVSLLGALVGALGYAAIELIVQKLSK